MHISTMDRKLFQHIQNGKITAIDILSNFNTSMSGYSNGYFITILNDTKELLPMSLVLSGRIDDVPLQEVKRITISEDKASMLFYDERTTMEDLQIVKGARFSLTEQHLDRLLLFLQTSNLKEGFYPLLSGSNIMNLPQRTEGLLLGSDTFFLEKLNSFLNGLKNRELDTSLNIIGFGPGLTPSSDDFVLGLLSAFLHAGDDRFNDLSNYINLHKEKTTEVSRWMLHYAANHQLFPHIVKHYYQIEGTNLDQFTAHGGTSGMDLLCGIYTGLLLIIRKGVG